LQLPRRQHAVRRREGQRVRQGRARLRHSGDVGRKGRHLGAVAAPEGIESEPGQMKRSDPVDVIIVGAGLSGGITAAELSKAGMSVVCLEQGDWPDYANARADFDDYEVTADLHWGRNPNQRRS